MKPALPPEIEAVAAIGWHLYPCSTVSKAACFPGATDAATCDMDQIARWHRQYNGPNFRVVFGPSGMWGLDCDVPPGHAENGITGLQALIARNTPLPPRPTARSGGGGLGLFWKASAAPIRGDAGHPAPGIDPRRGRQSQTIPPSIHIRTRQPYRWLVPPWEVAPPEAPEWLLAMMREPPRPPTPPIVRTEDRAMQRLYEAVAAIQTACNGGRNQALNAQAYALGRYVGAGMIGEGEIERYLLSAALDVGLTRHESRQTIRSGIAGGRRKPRV